MNTEQALNFLKNNQPMPEDGVITQQQCDLYLKAMNHFIVKPDIRCVPLFINSISDKTGLGMYEKISGVLLNQDRSSVVNELKSALSSSAESIKYRCCWWAIDLDAWDLEELVFPLKRSDNEDVREAASSYLKLKHGNE